MDPTIIAAMQREANEQWIARVLEVFDQLEPAMRERGQRLGEGGANGGDILIVAERIVAAERRHTVSK